MNNESWAIGLGDNWEASIPVTFNISPGRCVVTQKVYVLSIPYVEMK